MKFYSVTAIDTNTFLTIAGGFVAENILDQFVADIKANNPDSYVSIGTKAYTECPEKELKYRLLNCYTETGKKYMVFAK